MTLKATPKRTFKRLAKTSLAAEIAFIVGFLGNRLVKFFGLLLIQFCRTGISIAPMQRAFVPVRKCRSTFAE